MKKGISKLRKEKRKWQGLEIEGKINTRGEKEREKKEKENYCEGGGWEKREKVRKGYKVEDGGGRKGWEKNKKKREEEKKKVKETVHER